MMKNIILCAVIGMFSTTAFAASDSEEAEKSFDAKCAICHSKTRPADTSRVHAPALPGVMRHVKMHYPDKKSAVEFMVDYVLNPSKEKAICMPQKIKRFGLMPSQKGAVSKEELKKITAWMYDNYPPKGFRGQGMGGNRPGM